MKRKQVSEGVAMENVRRQMRGVKPAKALPDAGKVKAAKRPASPPTMLGSALGQRKGRGK